MSVVRHYAAPALADRDRAFKFVDTLQHFEANVPTDVATFCEKGTDDLEGSAAPLALHECAQPCTQIENPPVPLDPGQRIERRAEIWKRERIAFRVVERP